MEDDDFVDPPRAEVSAPEKAPAPRTLAILQCLSDGIAKGRICQWLSISREELEEQTAFVVELLGAGNVGQAIMICLTNLWID
jgi:hypothetical protein